MMRCKINDIKLQTWTYADPGTAKKFSFTLVNQDSTWNEAKDACTARGARLVQKKPFICETYYKVRTKINTVYRFNISLKGMIDFFNGLHTSYNQIKKFIIY